MDDVIASYSCDGKHILPNSPEASIPCTFSGMETIGQRIKRLRHLHGIKSRPALGRLMQAAINRKDPFTGEAIRRYEEDIDEPGNEARKALALVFGKTEQYIEFGHIKQPGEKTPADLMYEKYLTADDTAKKIIDLALTKPPTKKDRPSSQLKVVRKS